MGIFGKEEPGAVAATFFNVEWASPACDCVICSECGYIHWFVPSS